MNEQRIAIAGYWCKIIAVVCGLASGLAAAQETYPAKPVRIVVPFTPGTGIDILARSLGQKMGDDWKVGVVVENRPGASGNIGTEAVAKSAPDGYTLLMTASTFIMNRSLFKSIPYDPIADFAPVAPLAIGQLALVCCPGEFTTTAGRRLLDAVDADLRARGATELLICTYCNDYMGYTTTREEYEEQCYEGGHTIFGQWQLAAFQTRFAELARELRRPEPERGHDRATRPRPVPAGELALRADLPVPGYFRLP